MSNFPPGVSGLEPAIAGYPEGEAVVECPNMLDASKVRFRVVVGTGRTAGGDLFPVLDPGPGVDALSLEDHGIDEIECRWSGTLDVQYVGEEAVTSCPRCGGEIRIHCDDLRRPGRGQR